MSALDQIIQDWEAKETYRENKAIEDQYGAAYDDDEYDIIDLDEVFPRYAD